jgi:alkanesulfonate monooxygenase SsuD/methylene tetrahydromethanopterin reductase-like flavin-dependent oxidoreductase (luciferase family)
MAPTTNTPDLPNRGFGIAGATPPDLVRLLARDAEGRGYHSFWVNDTPQGDGLAALAAAAPATDRIRLGVGVIPLDRQPPARIAARIAELALPTHRLTVGIGSGGSPGGLARVRAGLLDLRQLTDAAVAVGALGPRMCALAGELADAVLLNWLTPPYVRQSVQVVQEAAAAAGRPQPLILGYVRTALGPPAIDRLEAEGQRYAGIPAYAAHFERMNATPLATAVTGTTPTEIRRGLAPFDDLLDETIVRAITAAETPAAYRELLTAAAPA